MRAWLPILVALLACDEPRVPIRDDAPALGPVQAFRRDVSQAPPEGQIDVLFVIDNSASMCRAQANLTRTLDGLFDLAADGDVRVAVTSTDLTAHRGAFLTAPALPIPQPGCLDAGGAPFVPQTAGCADRALAPILHLPYGATAAQRAEARADLACMTTLGTTGDEVGRGLEAMRRALSCDGPNGDRFAACCVDGAFNPACTAEVDFLRPDAVLLVLILSDSDDCSAPGGALAPADLDQCAWRRDALTPVDEYGRFLANLKPRPVEQLRVVAVVGDRPVNAAGDLIVYDAGPYLQPACDPDDPAYDPTLDFTEACCPEGRCRGPVQASCALGSFTATAGHRYLELAEQTDGIGCPAGEGPGPDCVSICTRDYDAFDRFSRGDFLTSYCLMGASVADLAVEVACTEPGCAPIVPATVLAEGLGYHRAPEPGCDSGEVVRLAPPHDRPRPRSTLRLTYAIDPPSEGRAPGACALPAACAEPYEDPSWTESTRICVVEGGCGDEDCVSWESGPARCAPQCTRDADCGAGRCASPLGIPAQQPTLCDTAPCHCLPR